MQGNIPHTTAVLVTRYPSTGKHGCLYWDCGIRM